MSGSELQIYSARLSTALHALKEDATHAWKQALEGGCPGHVLEALGRSIKNLEKLLIEMDSRGKK